MTIDPKKPGKTGTLHPRNSKGAGTAQNFATSPSESDQPQSSTVTSVEIAPATVPFAEPTASAAAHPIQGEIDPAAFIKELMVHDKIILDYLAK